MLEVVAPIRTAKDIIAYGDILSCRFALYGNCTFYPVNVVLFRALYPYVLQAVDDVLLPAKHRLAVYKGHRSL